MKTFHIIAEGRVQRVGFRYFVHNAAKSLQIRGWIRNRLDGAIEIMAQGNDENVEKLIYQIKKGPSLAKVIAVTVNIIDYIEFKDFKIKETE
ncbi:MAG TPA: acylphosphatase [Spirochaetia bacterium]|nr:MAG: hypothetical protein A2Y41_01695 [Spirochaetes bacterium GWB1_36_13]HCL56149.1 acylphosphatase [Spirochaetia bacterium]